MTRTELRQPQRTARRGTTCSRCSPPRQSAGAADSFDSASTPGPNRRRPDRGRRSADSTTQARASASGDETRRASRRPVETQRPDGPERAYGLRPRHPVRRPSDDASRDRSTVDADGDHRKDERDRSNDPDTASAAGAGAARPAADSSQDAQGSPSDDNQDGHSGHGASGSSAASGGGTAGQAAAGGRRADASRAGGCLPHTAMARGRGGTDAHGTDVSHCRERQRDGRQRDRRRLPRTRASHPPWQPERRPCKEPAELQEKPRPDRLALARSRNKRRPGSDRWIAESGTISAVAARRSHGGDGHSYQDGRREGLGPLGPPGRSRGCGSSGRGGSSRGGPGRWTVGRLRRAQSALTEDATTAPTPTSTAAAASSDGPAGNPSGAGNGASRGPPGGIAGLRTVAGGGGNERSAACRPARRDPSDQPEPVRRGLAPTLPSRPPRRPNDKSTTANRPMPRFLRTTPQPHGPATKPPRRPAPMRRPRATRPIASVSCSG